MESNQLVICVKSDNHDLPETVFWLGFVIHHSIKDSAGVFQPSISMLEIIQLGLSVSKRQFGAFHFPIELRNQFRLDTEVMFQYLLDITDVDEAFKKYQPISKIDFYFASKNKRSIAENHGMACLDFITSDGTKTIEINQLNSKCQALFWQIATVSNRHIQLDIQAQTQSVMDWSGDMNHYISYLNQNSVVLSTPVQSLEIQPEVASSPISNTIAPVATQRATILSKGANMVLAKSGHSLHQIIVSIGWKTQSMYGTPFEIDVSAFLLGENGKVTNSQDFIFFNQSDYNDGLVTLVLNQPVITINLERLSPEVKRIDICASIDDAVKRKQNFGQVSDLYIKISQEDDVEFVRFELPADYNTETAMIFGEIYRHKNDWKFKAVGQGYSGGLKAMCDKFGIEVS